jgi:hypothetical protein
MEVTESRDSTWGWITTTFLTAVAEVKERRVLAAKTEVFGGVASTNSISENYTIPGYE